MYAGQPKADCSEPAPTSTFLSSVPAGADETKKTDGEAPGPFVFGRFQILPHRRELLADGRPVKLGGRAFDVLVALIEARGVVISKDALMARVWPGVVVEENNLQVQIAALRGVFGPDHDLIRTVHGRGYQFTGALRIVSLRADEFAGAHGGTARAVSGLQPTNLPKPVTELIGRDDALRDILRLARTHRLVTLTGTGGIGKTRLAVAVAHCLREEHEEGVWFADLAPLVDPGLVPAAVAAAAGLELIGPISAETVARALIGKRLLFVLDNCEHVIDAAAAIAEALLRANPAARVIATSREPLNAEGEWRYEVPPLAVPREEAGDQDDIMRYGAVRLFVERARAAQSGFEPNRRDAAMISAICRQLDGIPLAVELAAARTVTLGLKPLGGSLDEVFPLLAGGWRTAPSRHQSLRAALDWSDRLLTGLERAILGRLAIFPGNFGLRAALAESVGIPEPTVIDALGSLITKSLILAERDHLETPYRLFATTRAYALDKLADSGGHAAACRSAEHCRPFRGREGAAEQRPRLVWATEDLHCPQRLGDRGKVLAQANAA